MALAGILKRAMPLPRRVAVYFAPYKVLSLYEFVGAKELESRADRRGRQARRGF